MTKIGNKDISLAYNFLNLPGGKGAGDDTGVTTPAWTYSANGAKLKYENKDYIDGIEYKDGELYCIHHAEGRIYPKEQTDAEIANNVPLEWEHNFYLRDHLGNTRIVLNGAGIPIQENNYYPFGMNIENIDALPDNVSRDSRYTYNGKEMNEDLGWLDYGARFYDPAICRWNSVDPMAEKYMMLSSYNYVADNPINIIDPDGMQIAKGSQKQFNNHIDAVANTRDRLGKKLGKLIAKAEKKGWTIGKLQSKAGNLGQRITSLNSTMDNLNKLDGRDVTYRLNALPESSVGFVDYDSSENQVVINYARGSLSNFVHESTHAGQYETRDIGLMEGGIKAFAVDIYDKVDAYRAQWAVDPNSTGGLSSINEINGNWVRNIKHPSTGEYLYRGSHISPISIRTDSPRSIAEKAYLFFNFSGGTARTEFKNYIKGGRQVKTPRWMY